MIQFTKETELGLKEDESYMTSTKVNPSPLIKVKDKDITNERWKSITDEDFFKHFCNSELYEFIEDNTEG